MMASGGLVPWIWIACISYEMCVGRIDGYGHGGVGVDADLCMLVMLIDGAKRI